jgi:hypothetical protein
MVTSNTNPPELKLGQGVLHGGLYPLHSDLVNMHNLTPPVARSIVTQLLPGEYHQSCEEKSNISI